jgi:hypothetical protein
VYDSFRNQADAQPKWMNGSIGNAHHTLPDKNKLLDLDQGTFGNRPVQYFKK